MEDFSQYGNSHVGRPYQAAKTDAMRGGEYRNPYPDGSTAHKAYEQGHQQTTRTLEMQDEVRRHSHR